MKTRSQIIAALTITWSLAFAPGTHAAERSHPLKGSRPNIILVMTDDQGLGDMSLSGNTLVKTPHMDAFYANSTRLADFHVSPSCAPTRSVIMTGKHEFMHGVTHTKYDRNRLPEGLGTIAHEMKRAQYQTAIFGKWHLGFEAGRRPEDNGFDESFVLPSGGHGMFNMNPVMMHNGELVKCKGFSSEVIIGQTLSWIKSAKEKEDPFFIYLPTPAPHGPYKDNIPAEWKKKWLDQGYNQNVAGRYALKLLISKLRKDVKRPDMNIVIGRIGDYALGKPSPDAVRKGQREIADEDPHGAWIDVDDLNDREVDGKIVNAVHYNRPEGYITLGQRFARQGHALVTGKKPAENGKPTGGESE